MTRESTAIRITEVSSGRDLRRFLDVPGTLYRDDPQWVSPLRQEVRKLLDRRHNPFFAHGEGCFWIAWRGATPVGRISAQINRLHLSLHQDATGNFGFLEAPDDAAVFCALLKTAEAWLQARGMTRILGPYSPSINDEIGVLVAGFDTPPMLMMAHSPPYMAQRLEEAGYRKAKDVHAYAIDIDGRRNPDIARIGRSTVQVRTGSRLRTRPIDMRRLSEELKLAIDIYNDAWSDNWGFVPVTPAEVDQLVAALKPILRPELVIFGEIDGQAEAIIVALPNINETIADMGGRLLPFGWLKLLWRLHVSPPRSARVILLGVRKSRRHSAMRSALASRLIGELAKAGMAAGITQVELSWILEDNEASTSVVRHCGASLSKIYRLYQKNLTAT